MNRLSLACAVLFAAGPALAGPISVGDTLTPFSLKSYEGKDVSLSSYTGKKAVLLVFMATRCPVSNAYNERMEAIAKEYGPKGVAFVGINSNKEEDSAEIAAHAREHGFTFPILKDVGNEEADSFGAQVTPEAYLFDASWKLRYHGRIDDNRNADHVVASDLRSALDALLAGRDLPVKETKAFGCTIKRAAK
jgi:peroxiredoxin